MKNPRFLIAETGGWYFIQLVPLSSGRDSVCDGLPPDGEGRDGAADGGEEGLEGALAEGGGEDGLEGEGLLGLLMPELPGLGPLGLI